MDDMILVVTHKNFDDSNLPTGYNVIKVGNGISDEEALDRGWFYDKTKVNISDQNPWYCELTAQYWGWKNIKDKNQITGLVHYRRFFFDYKKNSQTFRDDILTLESARRYLDRYKVILSFPTVKYPGNSSLYRGVPEEKQDKHWVIIDKIIKENYPDLYPTFEKIIYGRFITWGNMLVTSKAIFDEYSAWIFEVLQKYDAEIEKRGEDRIPRVDGFLSELLLTTWMYSRFKKKEILFLEVRNTETDSFSEYRKGIKNLIVRKIRRNRHLLVLVRYLRILILLWTRRERGTGSIEYSNRK